MPKALKSVTTLKQARKSGTRILGLAAKRGLGQFSVSFRRSAMPFSYSLEQRKATVTTFHRLGSFAKTIRVLGYPSRHVLHYWVRSGQDGRKSPRSPGHRASTRGSSR